MSTIRFDLNDRDPRRALVASLEAQPETSLDVPSTVYMEVTTEVLEALLGLYHITQNEWCANSAEWDVSNAVTCFGVNGDLDDGVPMMDPLVVRQDDVFERSARNLGAHKEDPVCWYLGVNKDGDFWLRGIISETDVDVCTYPSSVRTVLERANLALRLHVVTFEPSRSVSASCIVDLDDNRLLVSRCEIPTDADGVVAERVIDPFSDDHVASTCHVERIRPIGKAP